MYINIHRIIIYNITQVGRIQKSIYLQMDKENGVSIQWNEVLVHATTQINLENILS